MEAPKKLRSTIGTARALKELANESEIVTSGAVRRESEAIARIESRAGVLRGVHTEWLEKRLAKLDVLAGSPIEREKFEESYIKGLGIYFKLIDRFERKNNIARTKEQTSTLTDDELIEAYTFDFLRTLSASLTAGATTSEALLLASQTSRHDPDVLHSLMRDYPDLEPWVVKWGAVNYPTGPTKFLDHARVKLLEVAKTHPQLESWILQEAAVRHPSDSEKFLDNLIERTKTLLQEYPQTPEWIIQRAIMRSKKPGEFIKSMEQTLERMRKEYPDASESMFRNIIIRGRGSG